jgi:hypothetical protein
MTAGEFASQIEAAARRGVDYLFIYTGGEDYKHRKQLFSILTPDTPRERIEVHHYPKLEHTPVLMEDRAIVAATLIRWLEERFFRSNPLNNG